MIDMQKLGRKSGMLEMAAVRVRTAHLERQRATKAYNQHIHDTKDVASLKEDPVVEALRLNMQLAKENHNAARQTYEALQACPPLED